MTAVDTTTTVDLAACEQTIERGLATFIEVGQALLTIRDERLYREGFDTFEHYCQDRWQMSRSRAYRLVAAAEIAEVVSPIGDIANEAQARELVGLDADTAKAVVAGAVLASGGKPTAADLRQSRDALAPRIGKQTETHTVKTEVPFVPETGEVIDADQWRAENLPDDSGLPLNPVRPVPTAEAIEAESKRNSDIAWTQSVSTWAAYFARLAPAKHLVHDHAAKYRPEVVAPHDQLTTTTLRDAAAYLLALADAWEHKAA